MKRLGCEPSDQMQKFIYLQAFYWVYENKYITETQSYISLLGLADVVIACEAMLTKSNKDPNFQLQYLVKNKATAFTNERINGIIKIQEYIGSSCIQ